jgi:Fe2+ transport system protein FeoA
VSKRLSDGARLRNGHVPVVRSRIPARIEIGHIDREARAPSANANANGGPSGGRRRHSMTTRLVACAAGDRVIVGSIEAGAARIDRLASIGILPGVELRVQQTRPVVVVECDETVLALERDIAAQIAVIRVVESATRGR